MTAREDYDFSRENYQYRLGQVLSDKQWQKVWASLDAVGVDADAIMFPEADPDAPSAKLKEISLREILPGFAYRSCARADFPKGTPKQMAAKLTRIIKSCNHLVTQCEAVLTRLEPYDPPNYRASKKIETTRGALSLRRDPLRDLVLSMTDNLETYAAKLKRWRDELPAKDTNRGNQVSTAHNLFWQELERIFDAHVGNDVNSRNQHEIRFLRACSEPFFPEVITDDDGKISAFVERRSTRFTSST
jgi:hypothetical protein